jgi:hypothetical protein
MAANGRADAEDRWRHLLQGAFLLEEQGSTRAAMALLDSALEVFADIDPVDDFEGYAVRRLLLALRSALSRGDR